MRVAEWYRENGVLFRRLGAVFAVYLAAIAAYAGVYDAVYRRDASAFYFAADIAAAQRAAFAASISAQATALDHQSESMEHVARDIEASGARLRIVSGFFRPTEVQTDSFHVRFRASSENCTPGICTHRYFLEVLRPRLARIDTVGIEEDEIDPPKTAAQASAWASALVGRLRMDSRGLRERISQPARVAHDAWTYADFLYFSTITQMTVGYGDIVPNNTLVRSLVVSQLCASALLLLVVVNIVLGLRPQASKH